MPEMHKKYTKHTYRLLGSFPDAVVLDDGLVERVEQVRGPHDIWGLGRHLGDAGAKNLVQHFDLGEVRAETLQHGGQRRRLIWRRNHFT